MGVSKRSVFPIRDGLLKVALEDVWSVKLHEKVIPDFIKTLKESIIEEKVVKDPVLVDEETLVILDGMHRVVALREMGCAYVPCCLINYRLPVVQLGAWYRIITGDAPISQILRLAKSSSEGLKTVEADSDSIYRQVGEGKTFSALRSSNSAWLITTQREFDCKEAYDTVYRIEEKLRAANLRVSYQTESDAKTIVLSDKSATCLIVPTLTKDDVLRVALRGEVFAPKATRHVFPFRLLGLNVSLDLLDGKKAGLVEANEKLQITLSSRKLVKLPGGQLVNGRRYEEPVYLFEN
ncbi:MAG: ParB N-terminal domain-containing protein [Promethearchaeati archaeon SRVP18_Atabeyarchaeia-1]